jgi:hypothetical protein
MLNSLVTTGDRILLHVNFTKAVNIRLGVRLLLRGVWDVGVAEYLSGDGTKQVPIMHSLLLVYYNKAPHSHHHHHHHHHGGLIHHHHHRSNLTAVCSVLVASSRSCMK